ncbi:OmpA family protein [Flavobacterium jejuense]|uniref:OmpA family protein n=1 Tax=Flavobacterium jejuense TaxID=1544455 RepID=A0ABX0IS85_9FLAO|nr:OmpA family protein [Flavobacterium jejuense]NHN26720.1 OmpA family protein [Flavobacterium jejuense]
MKKTFTLLCIIFYLLGNAQSLKLAIADKKYEKYSYIDAIKIYEKVANKGHKSAELFKRLGNSYYFNSELEKSVKWYKELFDLNTEVEPEYYYRYSQSLKSIEEYDKANVYLELFNQKTNDSRGNEFEENKNYIKDLSEDSGKYFVKKTTINSKYYDFGPSFYGDKIIFTSSRPDKVLVKKVHNWTDQNFTDLYISSLNEDNTLTEPENFSTTVNSKFNESSAIFTKDGKEMYFTRNNYLEGKKGRDKGMDKERTTLIKIYKASLVDGEWSNFKELPFNSDLYSTAHPSLSIDEKTLYFSSDRPGTLGGADIFKVSIDSNDKYGEPENLGSIINTEGRESFPFIGPDGTLYFASDGHLGLGGLDIFESKYKDNSFQKPKNIGKPINSSKDDFGFIINTQKNGYFTSSRNGGLGFDDIYKFTICSNSLIGIVTDLKTNEILPNSTVILFDENMKEISTIKTNDKAQYSFEIDCSKKYFIRAIKEEYETVEKPVTSNNKNGKIELNITLDKNIIPFEIGTDLAKVFNISLIYFDLDKSNIRPDAARDIQKVIEVMKEYPKMHVDIRSHTDSRQTHKYNEGLSDRRAKSTLEFMVANGIERERLTAKGFGETELINECSDGVPCSEEEHQKNRRSEFIVAKIE